MVYNTKAEREASVRAERKGNIYSVEVTGAGACKVILINAGIAEKADGAVCKNSGRDILLSFEKSGSAVVSAG